MQAPHNTTIRPEESPRGAPNLRVLVDLATALQSDEDTPRAERRHRDRAIGRECAPLARRPARQLAAWLAHPDTPDTGEAGRNVFRVHRLATLLLAVIGLFAGAGAAAAVFHYDGENPVNVIHVLAVFVFAQLLLVALTVLTMLPRAVLGYVPGARSLQETLSLLSPGRIWGTLLRRLPTSVRDTVDGTLGKGIAHRSLFGEVDKWAISHSAQWGALCFQVGALAGCLYLVVFSDLAFSWNTTLQVEPAGLHHLTSSLATPWASWLPDASPSLPLIESTRHFRLNDGSFPGMEPGTETAGPSALGGWWPFLVACMVVYGLLPRLATLVIATLRLRAVTRQALVHLPGARDLLDRLNGELVETAAVSPESDEPPPDAAPVAAPATTGWPDTDGLHVINWAGVDVTNEHLRAWFPATVRTLRDAGGARTLDQDRAVMLEFAEGGRDAVAILVRGWEPPMTEFVDFVAGLRQALGNNRDIAVIPVGVGDDHIPLPHERAMWQRRLDALGDPWLQVLAAGGPA